LHTERLGLLAAMVQDLRAELAALRAHDADQRAALAQQEGEIERMRAELEAARAVVAAARVGVGGIERRRAVAAYDAAVKAGEGWGSVKNKSENA
jgi:hypothetical protein